MVKVLVLQKFRDLKVGVIRQPDFVFEATRERYEELKTNLGEGFVVEIAIVEEAEGDKVKTVYETIHQDDEFIKEVAENYPKHIGGGYYELSNGEKVKGKETAIEAEKAIG